MNADDLAKVKAGDTVTIRYDDIGGPVVPEWTTWPLIWADGHYWYRLGRAE